MMMKITLLSLSLIAVAFGSASAESKAKPSTSHIAQPSAEKRLDGIPPCTSVNLVSVFWLVIIRAIL